MTVVNSKYPVELAHWERRLSAMKNRPGLLAILLVAGGCGDNPKALTHSHEGLGPHSGEAATFLSGVITGHLELKLHDDKGDLELWLCEDEKFEQPFDLALDAAVEVEFLDVDGRKITLRPRNTGKNEDEAGQPNVRAGKTNYFIFPSRDGEDASWLQGVQFQSNVIVRFTRDGQAFASEKFVAKPHVH